MSEESFNPFPKKSLDNMPDVGLRIPEKKEEQEAMRESVSKVVVELRKKNNYDSFKQAVLDMYAIFKIIPSTKETLSQRNDSSWKSKYEFFHTMIDKGTMCPDQFALDIEMLGEEAYANVYFTSMNKQTLRGKKRIMNVMPGACSLPNPVLNDPNRFQPTKERNFYRVFEEVIGVDPGRKDSSRNPVNPNTLQDTKKMYEFYVIDDKYYRVPLVRLPKRIKQLTENIADKIKIPQLSFTKR